MSQSSFLERLANRLRGKESKAAATYTQLVQQVADGKEPSEAAAEQALADAGKTAADLAADVGRVKDRRAAAATLKRGQAAARELEALNAKAAAAREAHNAAVEKLEREWQHAAADFDRRARELERQADAARQAEAFLRDSADHSATAGQTARLKEQLAEARRLRDEPLGRARRAGAASAEIQTALGLTTRPGSSWNNLALNDQRYRDSQKETAARLDAEEQDALRQAAPHDQRCRELEAELAELENTALVP